MPVAVGFALGLVVEVVALFLAILSSGAGHGDYAAARALFPVPMLTTLLEGDTIGLLSMTLALVQFPLLGALTGYCLAITRWTPLIAVGIVHLLAVLAAFSGVIPNFS
jgi:hypothetical protein